MSIKEKVWLDNGSLLFDCPGCGMLHAPNVENDSRPKWGWNGDMTKPTLTPSLLVRWDFKGDKPSKICHSFVTDGKIRFLDDCTHKHAGETLEMPHVD